MLMRVLPLLGLALIHPGYANTQCHQDAFGNTVCRQADGSMLRGHTDAFGQTLCQKE